MNEDGLSPREKLPYRRCVGAMVMNDRGEVFVGRRTDTDESEHSWQMPQGGIDDGEEPLVAALRELKEETAIRSVDLIGESDRWLTYDIPNDVSGNAGGRWSGQFRGQTQKWFLFRFVGDEAEIDLNAHDPAEFSEWKWVNLPDIVELVVPFKRVVYEALVQQFSENGVYSQ